MSPGESLTTAWEVVNRAECPCCGKPRENVIGLRLDGELYRMAYGHAEALAHGILLAVERDGKAIER